MSTCLLAGDGGGHRGGVLLAPGALVQRVGRGRARGPRLARARHHGLLRALRHHAHQVRRHHRAGHRQQPDLPGSIVFTNSSCPIEISPLFVPHSSKYARPCSLELQ